MTIPEQAVILCGGLGTRLQPITNNIPKALAPVNGKPFLTYLLNQLAQQGIKRVVLLTGYLGHLIKDSIGNGSNFGLSIIYSHGPTEWETGERLWQARQHLDSLFFLLYCDNYAPFSISRMLDKYKSTKSAVIFLVHPKKNGNLRLSPDGEVVVYDSKRSLPELNFVEIGYMLVNQDQFFKFLNKKDNLSSTLKLLVDKKKIQAVINNTIYSSISDLERLKNAEENLSIKPIILIDRDGTINVRPPTGEYLKDPKQIKLIDKNIEAMRELSKKGFEFIVLTNQAGIGRGLISPRTVSQINLIIETKLAEQNIAILDWYICPHNWDYGCICRKPQPGMLMHASKDYKLRLDKTFFIGDDLRDMEAAKNAGALGVFLSKKNDEIDLFKNKNFLEGVDLGVLVKPIIEIYSNWLKM
jgi:histidinol-phosphate phosphatase family protein